MAAAIPIIIAAVGATVSTVSMIKQGEAAAEAAEYNATQAAENARLSRAQAAEDERAFRVFSRKQLGDLRTGYAAAGVSIEGGSAGDILEEGAAQAEMDALKIREGGEIRARGFQSDATLSRMQAKAASTGGYLSGAAQLLRGGGQLYGGISRYGRSADAED